jgi:hypothetical protein
MAALGDLLTAADLPAVVLLVAALLDSAAFIASGVSKMLAMALRAHLILDALSRAVIDVIDVIVLALSRALLLIGRGIVNFEITDHHDVVEMNVLGSVPLGEEVHLLQTGSHLYLGQSHHHQLVLQRLRHLALPLLMTCFGDATPPKLH